MLSSDLEHPDLFQPSTTNGTPAANTTVSTDVLIYGCFKDFNTVACVRCALLAFLAVLTGVLCVLKVIRLHQAKHQNWHQYFIFYCASLECVIAGVHWLLSMYVQVDFVLQWLKLIQFLVMCHFYWTLATRALRREVWTKRFLVPFLAIACLYFTITTILGIVNVQDTFTECFEPYWLMMSSAEFIIVQLFCVAGFHITRRLNEISTLDSVRRSQKRDLWCIVIVFEISAFCGVLYDLSLRIIGDKDSGCSAIFKHTQELFSPIFLVFMKMTFSDVLNGTIWTQWIKVAKLLLPIWVMLFVFQPTPQLPIENDDLIPALSDDGNSAFSTNTDEQYRQLYHPTEDYRTLTYDTPTSRSPASTSSQSPTTNGAMYPPQTNNVQKTSQSNLHTIKEESHSRQPTPIQGSAGTQPPEKPLPIQNGKNQPSSVSRSSNGKQTDVQGNRRKVLPDNKVTQGTAEDIPKFSIQGNEGESPSPRGKFYI